jgi:hypothetical protein
MSRPARSRSPQKQHVSAATASASVDGGVPATRAILMRSNRHSTPINPRRQAHSCQRIAPGLGPSAGTFAGADRSARRPNAPAISQNATGSRLGDPACPVPAAFSTHGLFVSQRPDGHVQIIAVNHTGRESIEFIELVSGASGYSAIWRGCVAFEGGLFNDLVAYGSNGLIATVMLDKTLVGDKDPTAFLFSGAKTGYLAEWNPRTGWKHLPGSEAALNNGIQLSADSRLVWFTAWTSRQVLEYDLQAQRITRSVDVSFSPDNLTLRGDGTVIVAGIDDLARWRDCTAEEGHFCQDKLAFSVATLDPKTFTVKPLFHGNHGLLQGASVALAIDNALYVGTATGDRLLKIPSVELSTPREDVN